MPGIIDLLFHPDHFFGEIPREQGGLIPPLLIVLAGASLAFATTVIRVYLSGRISELVPAGILVPCVLESFALPFLGWILVSVVLYGIATRLYSGTGSYRTTLRNVGYGLLPWTLSTGVWFITAILFFPELRIVYGRPWETPQFASVMIFLTFIVWSCMLWVFGMKHAHGIPRRRAVASVLLLIGVYFLLMYAVTYTNLVFMGSSV